MKFSYQCGETIIKDALTQKNEQGYVVQTKKE